MTGLSFKRTVGAGADVKELEYITALHQTSKVTRPNATVSSMDIVALLRSRHSLTITHEQAIQVVRSLGGGDTGVGGGSNVGKNSIDDHFSSHNSSHSKNEKESDLCEDERRPAHGMKGGSKASNGEIEDRISSSTTKRMRRLLAINRLGQLNNHHMLVLKDEVVADMRARVLQRSQALRHLVVDDDDDEEDSVRLDTPHDPLDLKHVRNGKTNISSVQSTQFHEHDVQDGDGLGSRPSLVLSSKPTEVEDQPDEPPEIWDQEPESCDENDGDYGEDCEPLVEYLDLVQIMSTILIPKLARVCYDVKNETTTNQQMSRVKPEVPNNPGLIYRLKQRFLAYGRRKLKITEEEPLPFSAQEILDMGRQALLKPICTEAPVMDEILVQLLLLLNGEIERALDEQLVKEMVQVAKSPSGRFDQESLIRAITSDLSCWDPTCQDTPTTFFYDVFGVPLPGCKTKLKKEEEREAVIFDEENGAQQAPSSQDDNRVSSGDDPKRKGWTIFAKCCKCLFPVFYSDKTDFNTTFLGIDMVIDVYFSLIVHVLIWVSYFFNTIVYISLLISSEMYDKDCPGPWFGCLIADTLYTWVIIACMLVAVGLVHILPVSVGNNPADQSFTRQMFALVVILVNTIVPFLVVNRVQGNTEDIVKSANVQATLEDPDFEPYQFLTLLIGLALAFMLALQGFILLLVKRDHPHQLPRFLQMVSSATSWDTELRIYAAAKFKIDKIVSNALSLHKSYAPDLTESILKYSLSRKMTLAGTRDEISRNFVAHGESKEDVGGIVWTFWKLCDGSLYREEGLWVNTRLLVIQLIQLFLGAVLSFVFFRLPFTLANLAEDTRADFTAQEYPEFLIEAIPTESMVYGAFIPATFVAMATMTLIATIYIPSSISTVLKYRGHLKPSLGSPYFEKVRRGVDTVYMNTANAIYGFLGSAAMVYITVALVIFLFLWPYSREIAIKATAWIIALSITLILKVLVTAVCRTSQYRAYYRVRPAAARITNLALECWHIGVAATVLVVRILQFLAAAFFWIGRIDVPYLSEDVVLLGYGFDMVPTHYCKDLLVHEAHRHPYIEQLTQMYLMKLRHGDRFVSNACTAWRQLLVLAIMPWLSKYRVFKEERKVAAKMEAKLEVEREEEEDDVYHGVKVMKDEVTKVGRAVTNEVVDIGEELYGAGADIVDGVGKLVDKDKTSGAKATARVSFQKNSDAAPADRDDP